MRLIASCQLDMRAPIAKPTDAAASASATFMPSPTKHSGAYSSTLHGRARSMRLIDQLDELREDGVRSRGRRAEDHRTT